MQSGRCRLGELEIENKKLKANLRNTLEQHMLEVVENKRLKEKLSLAIAQDYCTICGETLDGYVPPEDKDAL